MRLNRSRRRRSGQTRRAATSLVASMAIVAGVTVTGSESVLADTTFREYDLVADGVTHWAVHSYSINDLPSFCTANRMYVEVSIKYRLTGNSLSIFQVDVTNIDTTRVQAVRGELVIGGDGPVLNAWFLRDPGRYEREPVQWHVAGNIEKLMRHSGTYTSNGTFGNVVLGSGDQGTDCGGHFAFNFRKVNPK